MSDRDTSTWTDCGVWRAVQVTAKALLIDNTDGDWIWIPKSVAKNGQFIKRGQVTQLVLKSWFAQQEQIVFEVPNDEGEDSVY